MRSSPFMSSMPDPDEPAEEAVKRTTVVLAREEELQSVYCRGGYRTIWLIIVTETRAEFEDESSIHIYSLEPGPIEV